MIPVRGLYLLLTLVDNESFGPGDPSFILTYVKLLKCYWQANNVKFHSIYQGESCNNTHHQWLGSMVGTQNANIIQWPVDIRVHKCFNLKKSAICVGVFDVPLLFRIVINQHLIIIIRDSMEQISLIQTIVLVMDWHGLNRLAIDTWGVLQGKHYMLMYVRLECVVFCI